MSYAEQNWKRAKQDLKEAETKLCEVRDAVVAAQEWERKLYQKAFPKQPTETIVIAEVLRRYLGSLEASSAAEIVFHALRRNGFMKNHSGGPLAPLGHVESP